MRLIDADKLIKELEYAVSSDKLTSHDDMFDLIERFPTADMKPVQHGKWIEQEDPYINTYECSNCGRWFTLDYGTPEENRYNYCPNCGAKMKGEEK